MPHRRSTHLTRAAGGSLAVCPPESDYGADADGTTEAILVSVDHGRLALAAAEDWGIDARLIDRFSGYDQALLDFARTLASESAAGFPNGPFFWNEVADAFIDGLLARHTARFVGRTRGSLGKEAFQRIRDFYYRAPRRADRGRRARKVNRSQPVPLHARLRPIGRNIAASLRRASAASARNRAYARWTFWSRRMRLQQASPTKAICRVGSGAFTAFPPRNSRPGAARKPQEHSRRPPLAGIVVALEGGMAVIASRPTRFRGTQGVRRLLDHRSPRA